MRSDLINLVDENGKRIGSIEKLRAHTNGGRLHEAFSIFVFNENNELLIHKRAINKYHSGGLWTNTCCSHPRFNEEIEESVKRRLKEEMGFQCDLKELYSFIYKKNLGDLTEYEYDHVFLGIIEKNKTSVQPSPEEASDFKWVSLDLLKKDIKLRPKNYTVWLKIILEDSRFNSGVSNVTSLSSEMKIRK